jgi:hypothetical protein
MIETKETSETLVFNSKLTRLIARVDFSTMINPTQDTVQMRTLVNTMMKLRFPPPPKGGEFGDKLDEYWLLEKKVLCEFRL